MSEYKCNACGAKAVMDAEGMLIRLPNAPSRHGFVYEDRRRGHPWQCFPCASRGSGLARMGGRTPRDYGCDVNDWREFGLMVDKDGSVLYRRPEEVR